MQCFGVNISFTKEHILSLNQVSLDIGNACIPATNHPIRVVKHITISYQDWGVEHDFAREKSISRILFVYCVSDHKLVP